MASLSISCLGLLPTDDTAVKADMSIIGNVLLITGAAGFTLAALEFSVSLLKRMVCFAIKSCRSSSAFWALRVVLALV